MHTIGRGREDKVAIYGPRIVRERPWWVLSDFRSEWISGVKLDADGTITVLLDNRLRYANSHLPGPTSFVQFDRRVLSHYYQAVFVVDVGRDLAVCRIEVRIGYSTVAKVPLEWAADDVTLFNPL
ncbi:hypothetical protein [Mycolicibacterium sp. P1-18]|uniref:hypothetical protein n=1 Tax=Mycolicibacterium sp. P1-18 TaxID=2024615 RepID=UPI0011F2DB1C|nr:hypothetical protein [Mycolicibacterium sp. P1-18]